jgi:hypothetical protein
MRHILGVSSSLLSSMHGFLIVAVIIAISVAVAVSATVTVTADLVYS